MSRPRNIVILGATGSIGVNALEVIQAHPDRYRAVGLAAGMNVELLAGQIRAARPRAVAVADEALAERLRRLLPPQILPQIFCGAPGYGRLATLPEADTVISAMSGAAGMLPTFEAIRAGKQIALANKETMVMAGSLVMAEAQRRGVSLLPIDSEHSAILQSLQGHPREDLKRIILTASGGPFRQWPLEAMRGVTPAQALAHPNWKMGPKITIDSATLMNKGLEVLEAKWLFQLDMEQIDILVHPQSVVHSMVEYRDGSCIAQLGIPDMRVPIAYALSYPHHLPNPLPSLELEKIGTLTFEKPDLGRFRCLALALQAAEAGGSLPAVLNAANEVAVAAFLENRIRFLEIPDLIARTMDTHSGRPILDIENVMAADRWARQTADGLLQRRD